MKVGLSAFVTMRYWVTPFPLSAAACSVLNGAGLQPWHGGASASPDSESLLLYDSPDQLIAILETGPDTGGVCAFNILQGYRQLLACSEQTGQSLLVISTLQRLGPEGLRTLFSDGDIASPSPFHPLPITPLLAAVTLSLLDTEPALLDLYFDLELRADLLGRDPDFRYRERLRQAVQGPGALLQSFITSQRVVAAASVLEQRLAHSDMQLQEAREAAELSLLQLHQRVQEERDQFLFADAEKQRQLEARDRELKELRQTQAAQESSHVLELQGLRERSEVQLRELEHRLASKATELQEAREAADLSLLELHQKVQEERDQYLLADAEKQRQLEVRDRELKELRQTQAAQESSHLLELQSLRERSEVQLREIEHRLASKATELQEAREAAELSLLQLHQQVLEERSQYLLADAEKQRKLEARDRELEELRSTKASQKNAHELAKRAQQLAHELEQQGLRELLEHQLAELHKRLTSRDTELREALAAAENSMVQLHKVEEDLENYFFKARASDQLAQAQLEQLQRAQRLMARFNNDVLPTAPYSPALAVEVLPELAAAGPDPSVQTQALLSTYAASLKRASALLERARRS